LPKRPAAAEDRKTLEEDLLVRGKQVVRPADRRSERGLSFVRVATAAKKIEATCEPGQDFGGVEQVCPCGGELHGEREIVKALAQLDHRRVRHETGSLAEERDAHLRPSNIDPD
jgi:hypothetical protein